MKKTLDLSTFTESSLEIKWFDGRVFILRKPTQRLVLTLTAIEKQLEEENMVNAMKLIDDYVFLLLSANKMNVKITLEEVENLDFDAKLLILNKYAEFIKTVQSSPN